MCARAPVGGCSFFGKRADAEASPARGVVLPAARATKLNAEATASADAAATLWEHRELLYFFAWRDLKVRYKNSYLGILWSLINPIIQVIVITIVMQQFMRGGSERARRGVVQFGGFSDAGSAGDQHVPVRQGRGQGASAYDQHFAGEAETVGRRIEYFRGLLASATGSGIKRAAGATESGTKKAVHATGKGLEKTGKALEGGK